MNKYIEVMAVVEGKTEQRFIEKILCKYLADKNIAIKAVLISKKGEKGGDVRFCRAKIDIRNFLKQRSDTYVTTFIDYYGIKEWPGVDEVPERANPTQIASIINEATKEELAAKYPDIQVERRFIPFIAVHEFEALLFSDSRILASKLSISEEVVQAVLEECEEPEAINNSRETAPSKRIHTLSSGTFKKTLTGLDIAEAIGIQKMRDKCPNFNAWLKALEEIQATRS